MDRSELKRLLEPGAEHTGADLPESFVEEVLRRGRKLRELVARHWQWLRWASLISLIIAAILGAGIYRVSSTEAPPPMLLFQSHPETFPFSTQ